MFQRAAAFNGDLDTLTFSCTRCRKRFRVEDMELLIVGGVLHLACLPCRVILRLEG